MTSKLQMPSPLEAARDMIRKSATARALEHCADIIPSEMSRRDVHDIAAWAAHFAIEMMRELHKTDEIRQEADYQGRLVYGLSKPLVPFIRAGEYER